MRAYFTQILSCTATFVFVAALPLIASAQGDGFTTLVGIPGVDPNTTDIGTYANALYTLSIGLAAVLAVGKIVLAGVQFMFSDIVTSREQAKKDIQGALLGLLIILGAVTILNTINPNLTALDIFNGASSGGAAQGTRSAAPGPQGQVQQGTNTYTQATEEAAACGGEVRSIVGGGFRSVCPGDNDETGGGPGLAEFSGWPQSFSSSVDAGQAAVDCQGFGGSPERETSGTPVRYVVHCYQ